MVDGICIMNLSWKTRANSSALLVSLPATKAMHVPWPWAWKLWQVLGAHKNPCQQPWNSPQAISQGFTVHDVHAAVTFRLAPSQRSSPEAISHGFPSAQSVHASVSLPPNGALPKLFPTVSCRPQCPRFRPAPSNEALPKLFPKVSCPSMMSTLPSRSLPTRSYPATISTLPSCSLATELSPGYFSVPRLGPTVFQDNSIDGNCPEKPAPPALHFCIAPSQPRPPPSYFHASQSMHARPALPPAELPPSYFHASHSIHASPAPVSLPPVRYSRLAPCSGASPKLFLRFAVHPCAPSSLPPAELPLSYFIHASQSIHAGPALPSRSLQRRSPEAISKLFPRFPLRPRSCLPSFLSSFLPSFLPPFLPVFFPLPSFLRSFLARPALLSRSPRCKGS